MRIVFSAIRLGPKTSECEKHVSVKSTVTGCDVTTVQQHYKGSTRKKRDTQATKQETGNKTRHKQATNQETRKPSNQKTHTGNPKTRKPDTSNQTQETPRQPDTGNTQEGAEKRSGRVKRSELPTRSGERRGQNVDPTQGAFGALSTFLLTSSETETRNSVQGRWVKARFGSDLTPNRFSWQATKRETSG